MQDFHILWEQALPYIHWAKLHIVPWGPLMTPIVASVVGGIALYSIHEQRKIARRRAAIDFFLKTDMDKAMVDAYGHYLKGVEVLNQAASMADFHKTPEYTHVRAYLNIHELVAVGIKNKVLDETTCYNYWSAVLVGHCEETKTLISYIRTLPGEAHTYIEAVELAKKWGFQLSDWEKINIRRKYGHF